MNKMPWFKFFPDDWITGTREMKSEEKAAWIDLLAFMWKAEPRGSVSGTWDGIARMLGLPWLDCETIVRALIQKKYLNVTDGNGVVTLTSRRMEREQKIRESGRIRKREFDKRDSNAKVTDKTQKSEVIKDKDIPPNPQRGDDGFDAFWKTYPRKTAKQPALKAWNRIPDLEAVFPRIMAAVAAQGVSEQWRRGVIPHAATWLNQRRWEDQVLETNHHEEVPEWEKTK